jgi:hypothetical protein
VARDQDFARFTGDRFVVNFFRFIAEVRWLSWRCSASEPWDDMVIA